MNPLQNFILIYGSCMAPASLSVIICYHVKRKDEEEPDINPQVLDCNWMRQNNGQLGSLVYCVLMII